ncbi:MAG: hypothetical protein JNL43_15085 [Flavobacteriales bacterium]|nr:hypothetical protein [Flavobacteriales bacterium]
MSTTLPFILHILVADGDRPLGSPRSSVALVSDRAVSLARCALYLRELT